MQPVDLAIVNPDRPDVIALITALDTHLRSLYRPESTHLLDIQSLTQPNIRFLLASSAGEAVGCGALRLFKDYAEVKRMYVQPDQQGKGIGFQILNRLEQIAREMGYATLRLETGIHQKDAIHLYERFGFVRCAPFGEYTDDPVSLCYAKHLIAI
jgi:putative acetyltransferase